MAHRVWRRYDPCAVVSDGVCYEQSFKWIDMSISYFEEFYGDLYASHACLWLSATVCDCL